MSDPKVLVVYFSRTGNTRRVALEIARQLGAEVEEIGSLDRRSGLIGYVRSAFEGWSGRAAAIRPPRLDPRAFDLVVIATPVWFASPASPTRAYLAAVAPALRNVAVVLTLGGAGDLRALGQLEEIVGVPAAAKLIVRQRDLAVMATPIGRFVDQLRAWLTTPAATPKVAPAPGKAA